MSQVSITLRQRAQLGDRARNDFVLSTHRYLPGSVIRGAYAAAWLARHGGRTDRSAEERAAFVRLFEGGVRFGPAFAGAAFIPLSVVEHKYAVTEECETDRIDQAVTEMPAPTSCPACKSPLVQVTTLPDTQRHVRRRTHVTITPSGVAATGQLVTRETLTAGLTFDGHLVAADRAALEQLAELRTIRLGGRRTTHGMADTSIDQDRASERPQRLSPTRVVVRLRSPAVFVDDQGRPSRDPNIHELSDALGSPVSVTRRWVRWTTVGGWHVASGLPKPTELAVAGGSTYVVEARDPVTDEALHALGMRGLGLRRHEGFGDLGGAFAVQLGPGAERARIAALTAPMSSLVALSAQGNPQRWQVFLTLLRSHVAGDTSHRARLDEFASQRLNPRQREALVGFLTLDPADGATVLAWLEEKGR